MLYYHVDVFSRGVLSGNGLTVIVTDQDLDDEVMLGLAKEFKQFETIFLRKLDCNRFYARIFTVEEELEFAGHPILGATATIHDNYFLELEKVELTFILRKQAVVVNSKKTENTYEVQMNQGSPEFLSTVPKDKYSRYLAALNLSEENLDKDLPLEVVSTGLPYLLVPIRKGMEQASIRDLHFEGLLKEINAKFVYVFDVNLLEGRTWDNCGKVEDVATGSAAGPMGAYLMKHKVMKDEQEIVMNQGRFVGRPSLITVTKNLAGEMIVSGNVAILAKGTLQGG